MPSGPVGKARRRLHELLEDSFSLFGSRDAKSEAQLCATRPTSAARAPDILTIFSETKGRITHARYFYLGIVIEKHSEKNSAKLRVYIIIINYNIVSVKSQRQNLSRKLIDYFFSIFCLKFMLMSVFNFVFSPISSPLAEMQVRPRTSLPVKSNDGDIAENGHFQPPRSRSGWGSRPLSAGPFHRPNLPDVDTRRILVDSQLPPEDPAVPLIASIKRELEKFSPQ